MQASVLQLYDPERSRDVIRGGVREHMGIIHTRIP